MAQLTSSPGEYPANRGLWLDYDAAPQTSATSGQRCCALLTSTSPLSCLLRMCLASSAWRSTAYSLTWTPAGTKRGRLYFRLRLLARRTDVSASSSWATPDTRNAQDGTHLRREAREALERGSNHAMSLHHQVAMWTARQERTLREKGIYNGLPLNVAVKMWPTPRAAHDAGPHSGAADSLWQATRQPQAMWSTPAAQDIKNATCPASQATLDTLPGDLLRAGERGKLNPQWVESLMGFPEGWTEISETTAKTPTRTNRGQPGQASRNTSGKRRASRARTSPTAPHG